ncbi:MAG: isochorismatase family protein [Candidatus Aegiribacteria sp.]|nr:isochorismatase family protein [Candidatus Aegiribacteria sp.]
MYTEPFVTPDNIDDKLSEWLARIEKHTHPRPHLTLKADKCALIVVDMLHYFADPGGRVYLPSTRAIIPRIAMLLKHWRRIGGTVVYTRHCHSGSEDLGMLGRFFSDYIRCGKKESEIISDLSPLPGERVLRKNTYDAFYNTGLDEFLRSRSVEQVLVTGVLTQMCCETTARSAFVRGYEVYIPADAVATSSEELHIGSLMNLASGFAVITDASSICGYGLQNIE